jgi:hypothetical protein
MKPSALVVFLAVLILLISLIPAVLFIKGLSNTSTWLYSSRFISAGIKIGLFTILVLGIIATALVGGIIIIARDRRQSELKQLAAQETELTLTGMDSTGFDEMMDSLNESLDHLKALNSELLNQVKVLDRINENLILLDQNRSPVPGKEPKEYTIDVTIPYSTEQLEETENRDKDSESKRILAFRQTTLNSSLTITHFN